MALRPLLSRLAEHPDGAALIADGGRAFVSQSMRPYLVAALAEPFRETFVLREIQNLSYREIAKVAEVPVGTVMSRLARARAMLRSAWLAEEEQCK